MKHGEIWNFEILDLTAWAWMIAAFTKSGAYF